MIKLNQANRNRIIAVLPNRRKAEHLAFRVLGPQFQRGYAKHHNLNETPKVFMHGNPHLDNYVRTFTGVGMVDFDRSRIGPYSWDIIRFLGSLRLHSEIEEPLNEEIIKCFYRGYKSSFRNPEIFYTIPSFLKSIVPKPWQLTMQSYIVSNKKWARKLEVGQVDHQRTDLLEKLQAYLKSRKELRLLNYYKVTKAGISPGSLGKKHYLLLLESASEDIRDPLLIDLKQTYTERNTPHFFTPTQHQGLRMIRAANLYAPNVEQRLGYFTVDNEHFWGREIPSFNAKIKFLLSTRQQEELAYTVGVQLGRGHRLSLYHTDPNRILSHLKVHLSTIQEYSEWMLQVIKKQVSQIQNPQELLPSK